MIKINESDGRREEWADIVKSLGMLLVILAHTDCSQIIEYIINPFFLSIFFFVSGYFWKPKKNFNAFLISRTRSLVIPLFLLGGIGIIKSVLMDHDRLVDRLLGMLLQIKGRNDTLWFLSCLFTVEILFYGVYAMGIWIDSKRSAIISTNYKQAFFITCGGILAVLGGILSCSGVSLPWHIETAMMSELFFVYGFVTKNYYKLKYSYTILGFAMVAYIVLVCLFPLEIDLHLDKLDIPIIFYLQAFMGSTAFVQICLAIEKCNVIRNSMIYRLVLWIGQNTIQYFFLQPVVISVLSRALPGYSKWQDLRCIVISVAAYFLIVIPAWLLRFFPWLVGKRK